MRVKAGSLEIDTQDYTITKGGYENLYKGYRTLDAEKSDIDRFFKDGVIETPDGDYTANEYCIMTSPEQSSAVCRYDSDGQLL